MPHKNSSHYLIAACWIILVNLISTSNDAVSRYLGEGLHPFQIAFCRFFISLITVLPFMISQGLRLFKTKMPALHFWRTFWGTLAIALGTYSVLKFQIVCNTSIMFAEPVLFLPLAAIFLKERITGTRLLCTVMGLIGIFIVLYKEVLQFNAWFFVPLSSAFLFAVICVIAKKMVETEPIITSLFYFALGTTLLSFIPAVMVWKSMTWSQIGIVMILGINANLIQVCMFKAYSLSEATPLMPLRYLEFAFSWAVGYFLFHQSPTWNVFAGCGLIALSAMLVTWKENMFENKNRANSQQFLKAA